MATSTLSTTTIPDLLPSNDQIGLITGKVETYNASNTLTGYELHYYSIPFFVYYVIMTISIFLMGRFTIEFIKRWKNQP